MTLQTADGSWTYIIPRPLNGGTIIGGTKQPDDWNPCVEPSIREAILRRAAQLYPELISNGLPPCAGGFDVLGDIVGRRPTRQGGPRIEREKLGDKVVIHAYGVGEIGYKLSWGVAYRVLDLVSLSDVPKL
jgi:glycine/D-amino acid oxidase-like deaminating enzyme